MNDPLLSPDTVVRLLSWFDREGKAYPWGEKITPYRVWVSEIMLQQTVVTAAVPYFNRWMERFPSPRELAAAEEEEVLRYWEGLGYYSRGRNLLKAARYIREHLNGEIPQDLKGWKALPGVGEYTARAVLSIALGRPYAVLDANVRRIGQRILGLRLWPAGADQGLMESLEKVIPQDDPGKFNAALMQLGQLVCRTGMPLCTACPLRQDCTAAEEGTAAEIPERKKRTQTVLYSRRFLFVRDGGILMIRRNRGLGRGLWVFPGMEDPEKPCRYGSGASAAGEAVTAAEPEGPGLAGTPAGESPRASHTPGGSDPRGFPRGIQELLLPIIEKLSPVMLKPRRHTYTRYREDLSVLLVNEPDHPIAAEEAYKAEAGEAAGSPNRLQRPASLKDTLEELIQLYAGSGWEVRWLSSEEISRLPLPAVYRKIWDEARALLSYIPE